jgi:mono/diheme cytochrome c family protein
MSKLVFGVTGLIVAFATAGMLARADTPAATAGTPPAKAEAAAPKGSLHNPFSGQPDKIALGHKLFMSYGCSGCHGGNGGGGMCPPLGDGVWIYGGDDDTLFRLVTLGSQALQAKGYTVKAMENVVGPMPPFGNIIKSETDLWQILTFIRSIYHGDPKHRLG